MTNDTLMYYLTLESITDIFLLYIRRKNIIGIDNIDNNSFQKDIVGNAQHIRESINDYSFSPYMEKLISKGRQKNPRIISIPTIKDRIVLYILKEVLHNIYSECVHAEIVNNRITELFNFISTENTYSVIKIDIKGFYDSINQKILLDILKSRIDSDLVISLIEKAISNPTVPKKYRRISKENYYQDIGIPQGLSISNILANIYLKEIDIIVQPKCKYYYRYVDDMLILCEPDYCDNIFIDLNRRMKKICLDINQEKSSIINNSESFSFLGYEISKEKISIKSDSLQKHINSIFALLSNYNRLYKNKELREKWVTDELLINRIESLLNEKITGAISENRKFGWLFYFSSINDTTILHKIDSIMSNAIVRILPKEVINKLKIKKYVRAFYEIKNRPKAGYIENYDMYDTVLKKIDYLRNRGYIDSSKDYFEEEINYLFITIRERNLSSMQKDIGNLS